MWREPGTLAYKNLTDLVSLGKDLGFDLSLLSNLGDRNEDIMVGQWQ